MARTLLLTRTVTQQECDWLPYDFPQGMMVYAYTGATYGVIASTGKAITLEPDATPFYEVPRNALTMLEVRMSS